MKRMTAEQRGEAARHLVNILIKCIENAFKVYLAYAAIHFIEKFW